MAKKIIYLITVLFLSSCSIYQTRLPVDDIVLPLDEKSGYLVGSMSLVSKFPTYKLYTLSYRNKDTGEVDVISVRSRDFLSQSIKAEAKEGDNEIYIFLQKLPVGNYEIFHAYLYANGGWQTQLVDYSVIPNPFIQFSIKAGRTSYIGEYKVDVARKKNWFGIKYPSSGRWSVSNKINRDIKIFKLKYPQFSWNNYQNQSIELIDISNTSHLESQKK